MNSGLQKNCCARAKPTVYKALHTASSEMLHISHSFIHFWRLDQRLVWFLTILSSHHAAITSKIVSSRLATSSSCEPVYLQSCAMLMQMAITKKALVSSSKNLRLHQLHVHTTMRPLQLTMEGRQQPRLRLPTLEELCNPHDWVLLVRETSKFVPSKVVVTLVLVMTSSHLRNDLEYW